MYDARDGPRRGLEEYGSTKSSRGESLTGTGWRGPRYGRWEGVSALSKKCLAQW